MANVLIIDDDEDVTRLLETHLTEEGHGVTVAHDGRAGMDQVMKNVPDLIMLDVFLPDATGYQICNRIRKNESTKTTPIILMTGAARFPNQQLYGQQRGANEYIFKPFDIVQVGELVRKYITPGTQSKSGANSNLAALNAFLKQKTTEAEVKLEPTVEDEPPATPQLPESMDPLIAFGRVSMEPKPAMNGNGFHALEPAPMLARPALEELNVNLDPVLEPVAVHPPQKEVVTPSHRDAYVPPFIEAKERVIDFGIEIFNLATRLCSTPAEKYLSDQLLRTSLSVGAKLNAAEFAGSADEYAGLITASLRDLRESAYWLMLTRKAGLLERLAKPELEQSCQSLISLLADFDKNH